VSRGKGALLYSSSKVFGGGEVFLVELADSLCATHPVYAVVRNHELATRLKSVGVEVNQVNRYGLAFGLFMLLDRLKKVEVVILNGLPESWTVGLVTFFKRRLVVAHSNEFWVVKMSIKARFQRLIYRLSFAGNIHFIGVSRLAKDNLSGFFGDSIVSYVPNWPRNITVQRRCNVGCGPTVFGFMGRLAPEKGVLDLLHWTHRKVLSGHQLYVAGDGPLRNSVVDQVSHLAEVTYLGFCSPSLVFEQVDVLIVPSHMETCPLVILEAFASEVIVIATAVGGNIDLVEDGVTGFLFEARNYDSLSRALTRLYQSDLQFIKKNAKHKVNETFSKEKAMITYRKLIWG